MNRDTLLSRLAEMHDYLLRRDDRAVLQIDIDIDGVRAIAMVEVHIGGFERQVISSVDTRAFDNGVAPQVVAGRVYDRLQEQLVRQFT